MSEINEAYRVLGDPARRAVYDGSLRTGPAAPPTPAAPVRDEPLRATIDPTPARYPWKLVAVMAAVGAGVVLAGAALYEPPDEPRPDNVLQPGSCVVIDLNRDAREVACTGATGELVVDVLVPIDAECPTGTSAHRDRQGMGTACIVVREP